MQKVITFTFLLATVWSHLFAQSPGVLWAKNFNTFSNNHRSISQSMAVDVQGNCYITGYLMGTVDFDPGPGVYNLSSTAVGFSDIFICKLNSEGDFVWALKVGGTGDDKGYAITLDDSANIYYTGSFMPFVDFDPGPGVYNVFSSGAGEDLFVSKLDSAGNFRWAFGTGSFYSERGYSIEVDKTSQTVYTSGYFHQSVDFDPGTSSYYLVANGNSSDGFLLKLDLNGNFIWAIQALNTGSGSYYGMSLASNGNIACTGYFNGTADFDPSLALDTATAIGGKDIFVTQYNSSGNLLWARVMAGPTANAQGNALTHDNTGNVYVTGSFQKTVDFDPDPVGVYNLTCIGLPGHTEIYIVKLNSQGHFVWAGAVDGLETSWGSAIKATNGYIYASGTFADSVDFDFGAGVYEVYPPSQCGGGIFYAKYTNSGNLVWVKGTEGDSCASVCYVTIAPSGNPFLVGYQQAGVIFGNDTLPMGGGFAATYVVKLDTVLTGIAEPWLRNKSISLYPNPCYSSFTIDAGELKLKELAIYNMLGEKIGARSFTPFYDRQVVNVPYLKPGIYFVQLKNDEAQYSAKLIIE